MQWLTAFKTAFENSGNDMRYQRELLDKRRLARDEEKERDEEEMLKYEFQEIVTSPHLIVVSM